MDHLILIYITIFFLTTIQSILGVGILVLGTPLFLIIGIDFIDILALLLPISLITSFGNIIYFKKMKRSLNIKIDKETRKIFFLVCLPSIFIGLLILKNFEKVINIKYFVSFVILFSLIILNQKKILIHINQKIRIFILFLIGTIHGLTNSGGSLLSVFISSHQEKNQSRYNITYYYFFLALFQYLIFLYLFQINIKYFEMIINVLVIIPIGIVFGNFLNSYIDAKVFKILVNILALIISVLLIIL